MITACGEADQALFVTVLAAARDPGTTLVEGSITSFADHASDAMANAANMEVRFGGGTSGVIGRATGGSAAVDREAAAAIEEFWERNGVG